MDLRSSLGAVTSYLRHGEPFTDGPGGPTARQLAADLGQLRRDSGRPPAPSGTGAPAPTSGAPAGGAGGPVGPVSEVACATLNAVDFPSFVGSLIQGTFQAIVDASIQQMEAYAELLKQVASTVDQFMAVNVSDGMARDHLVDRYPDVLDRDTVGGSPHLVVREDAPDGEMPSFFSDLGFTSPGDLDENSVEDVVVPAARRTLAEQRQQILATMVLMGINRILVSDGEITVKLQFHVDASESADL